MRFPATFCPVLPHFAKSCIIVKLEVPWHINNFLSYIQIPYIVVPYLIFPFIFKHFTKLIARERARTIVTLLLPFLEKAQIRNISNLSFLLFTFSFNYSKILSCSKYFGIIQSHIIPKTG